MAVNPDPDSHAHEIVVAAVVAPIVTTLFVIMRVLTRKFVTRALGWDDCKSSLLTRSPRC